jgi:hypothetical protein
MGAALRAFGTFAAGSDTGFITASAKSNATSL